MSAIQFENVSKQFTLHRHRSRSFQELFLNMIRRRRRTAYPTLQSSEPDSSATKEHFWALRDATFAIEPGEMVGVIGSNGAGKSTILKLITRIIDPTSGQIRVNGRVGALLELGTGFHPDLTGRENIYLNGSIVGFSRAEMSRLFDDIVAFSELERFIDVPVKQYSSGMYMRLGFSIAIHVQPDILLVDEVLAVGDRAFQLQCLDRISEMKRQGVCIVLVTHDLNSVRNMCNRAIWLDKGMVRGDGLAEHVLDQYLTHVMIQDEQALLSPGMGSPAGPHKAPQQQGTDWRWGSREAEIVRLQLLDGRGQERRVFRTGETLVARIHFCAHQRIVNPQFGLALHHTSGFHINGPNTVFAGLDIEAVEGEGFLDYTIEHLPLLEGSYLVSVSIYDHEGVHAYDHHHQAYTFHVQPDQAIREKYGSIYIPATWRMGPPVDGA